MLNLFQLFDRHTCKLTVYTEVLLLFNRKHHLYVLTNKYLYVSLSYFLLLQLGETLMEENPNVDLQIIEVEKEGICIRFSPLESAQG